MIQQQLDGWAWWRPADCASALPPAWHEFLASQTLPCRKGDGEVFYLFADNLPEAAPEPDITLLERLAFALLSHPDSEAAVQPLHLGTGTSHPVAASELSSDAPERIGQSGFIALASPGISRMGEELELPALLRAGFQATVLPRALLAETGRLEFAPNLSTAARSVRGAFKDFLRRHLSPEIKLWLRRQMGKLPAEPQAPQEADPSIARHRHWDAWLPHPAVAIRPAPDDGRISVWFAVHWLELGGAEKFAVDLIRALPKNRYRVIVTTDVPSANPWVQLVREHAEEILHLPEFLGEAMHGPFAAHLIASRNIRLIHIHHAPRVYGALPYIRRLFPEVRVLHTLHILELPPNPGGYPEHSLRHYGPFIDHHHVVSRHLERFLRQRWLVPASRIDVVYLNVDVTAFDPDAVPLGQVRKTHGVPPEALLIGFIGRLTRQKRPQVFVEMARLLRERAGKTGFSQALHFVMAGDGDLRGEVEAAIREAGLESCLHLHGEVLDTRPVFADCDLLVLPSENEGLALVGYEAMAMARPVISTDVGAQRELIPRELLVADGQGLAGRLAETAWALALNATARAQIGRRCREHILAWHQQEQTWIAMLDLYERLLDGLPAAARPSRRLPSGEGWRLEGPAPDHADIHPRVAVAVVSYNHRDALLKLLSFLNEKGVPTFVTENASVDGTREALRGRFTHVAVLESPANLGGTGGFNCAVLAALDAGSDYVLLVDDDALPRGDCIERLAKFLDDHPDYVFAAPVIEIEGSQGVLQEAGGGVDFARPLAVEAWHRFRVNPRLPAHLDVDYASACCLMVRAEDIREIGVMDWNYFIFSDDVDWSLRLRQELGKRGACVTSARAGHEFPWGKPFSPMRLYYFVRNGIYLTSRFARGKNRGQALRWCLRRPLRRWLYAAAIGDREIAATQWRALRDAWTGAYGRWRDPVAFPGDRELLDSCAGRVLVDINIEDLDQDILAALRSLGGSPEQTSILCDAHRVDVYRRKGGFAGIWGRSPGLFGPLRDWWWIYRSGYDLVVTDAGMEPRRPSSLAGRRSAWFHAGKVYEAGGVRWLAPLAYLASIGFAVLGSALLYPRFLKAPRPGTPSPEAAQLLESLGYDGAVGQPWARIRRPKTQEPAYE